MKTVSTIVGLFAGLLLLISSVAISVAGEPSSYRRIVSINLSADELILQLADPDQIAALSRLASDPELSRLAGRAARFPATDGSTEQILRLRPDIVFASQYTAPITSRLLQRTGVRVVHLPEATTLAECRELVRQVADILGVPERGESLIRQMDDTLQRISSATTPDRARPTALLYSHGGYTRGTETLGHQILEAAGFENHATSFGIQTEGVVPLEALLLSPPDFLILLSYYPDNPTLGAQLVRHPALRHLPEQVRTLQIPLAWTLTGNNLIAQTIEHLWQQRELAFAPDSPAHPPRHP